MTNGDDQNVHFGISTDCLDIIDRGVVDAFDRLERKYGVAPLQESG